jgi:hypothetical protein
MHQRFWKLYALWSEKLTVRENSAQIMVRNSMEEISWES